MHSAESSSMGPPLYSFAFVLCLLSTVVLSSDRCTSVCEECLPPPVDCLGQRQITDGCDCCVVCAGQAEQYCDNTTLPCDAEFDLICEEHVCKGAYDLQVTWESPGSLAVQWSPFLPASSNYRYALFYITVEFNPILEEWSARDVGVNPEFVLDDVQANTDYFIQVVSMTIDMHHILTKSEVLVHKTHPRACLVDGISRRHGEHYFHECNATCFCYNGVEMCTPRCQSPGEMSPGPTCPEPILAPPPIGECCPQWTCPPPPGYGSCEVNGNVYENGERFVVDCTAYCKCDSGSIACVSMCPPTLVAPSADCPFPRLVDVHGECCQQWECGPPPPSLGCLVEETYVHDGDWVDLDCDSRCQCLNGFLTCVPMCPLPLAPDVTQPSPLCPEPFIGKLKQDDCCEVYVCHHPQQVSPNAAHDVLPEAAGPSTIIIGLSPPTNPNVLAIMRGYDIYYTSNQNATELSQWNTKFVQVTRSIPSNERYKRDGVIQSQFFVEIEDLVPNTVYFIKLKVNIPPEDEGYWPNNLPFSETMVTKTGNASGGPCRFKDQLIQNGDTIQDRCVRSCRCNLGVLLCQPLCQNHPLVPSDECPVPKLVTIEGQCCQEWRCNANEGDCRHQNRTYRAGEEWRASCDVRCFCREGAVLCQNLCPTYSDGAPAGCPGATLVDVPETCCQQWVCHKGVTPTPRAFPHVLPPFSLLEVNISAFDVTATMAVIRWSPLSDTQKKYITGFIVKSKDLLLSGDWRESEKIHPATRNYTLVGLSPGRTYLAQIVVLVEESTLNVHLDTNLITIHTTSIEESTTALPYRMTVVIETEVITDSSVTVSWDPLPSAITSQLRSFNIVYNATDDKVSKLQVSHVANSVEITGLGSDYRYSIMLIGMWANGTVLREIKSNVVCVETKSLADSKSTHRKNMYVIVGVVTATLVAILTVAAVCYLYVSKRKKSKEVYRDESTVAFENITYDTAATEQSNQDRTNIIINNGKNVY
uniref:Uncharacterized protein LOC100368823 n=1 Tax=Saccoglossus kowalevskii TaxID=10224 RepID=A0ABM0LX98_SACKO|nr:PREDICTED: uncharacterized protein LOC100368823 [Saccoglossus kowalevskii]